MNDALAHVGARKDLVALMHMGRFRPARNGRIVQQRFAGDHAAVHGNLFPRMQHHDVARFDGGDGHFHFHISRQNKGVFGGEVQNGGNGLAGAFRNPGFEGFCAALDPQDFQGGEGLTGKRGRGAASRQEAFQCKTLFPHVAQRLAHNRHGGQQRNDAQRGQGGFGHGGFQQHLTHKDIGHDAGKRKKSHQLSAHTCSRRLGRSAGATARARSRGPTIRLPRCGKGLQNGFGTGLRRLVGQHYGGAGRVDAHRLHPSQGPAYFSHLLRLRGRGYAQTQATFHGVSQKNFDRSGVVSHSFFHVLWQPRSKTPLC